MIGSYLILSLVTVLFLFFVRNRAVGNIVIGCFLITQWTLTIVAYQNKGDISGAYFTFDALGILFLAALSVVCIPAFYHSHVFFNTRRNIPRERGIFYGSMVALIASLSAAYVSNHIAVTWVFVELTTLSASALIYHNRNERTLEATWKYVFVGSVSITLVFIGILLLTLAVQDRGISDLSYQALVMNAPILDPFWLKLAFAFIFTGFTVKAGLVPMYTIGIDAKDKAPAPAGALLASVLMNVGFVAIFRYYEVVNRTAIASWVDTVLIVTSLLSIFISAVYIVRVKNLKRMLAYSGMEHMGIVMLGLAAGGSGYFAAILHLVLHTFAKAAMFFQVDQIYRIYGSKSIYDIGNYFRYHAGGAMVLLIAFFVISAMPPSGMFISEFMIFRSLFASGKVWVVIVVLLLVAVIIARLGKNIFKMLFIPTAGSRQELPGIIHPAETISQYILLGLVIYLGFFPPEELVQLIAEATKNLKNV